MPPRRARSFFSTIGLILGFIALALVVTEAHLLTTKPPEDKRSLGELAKAAGKKILKENILKEEPSPAIKRSKPLHPVRIAGIVCGLAAIGLGAYSWIKREHIRMSGAAIALGLIAICWEWVLVGVAVAIVIFILANLG